MRILVLGAGFGGLELTTTLADEFGADADIVLIDKADGFVFGFSKLDVMFGRTTADAVVHPYRDLVKPGVQFVQTTVRSIDPSARRVETDAGPFDADILVVALPPSPGASEALLAAFVERDIHWVGEQAVRALDPERKVAILSDGRELPYDLQTAPP